MSSVRPDNGKVRQKNRTGDEERPDGPGGVDEDGEVSSSEDERDEQQDLTRDEAKLLREVEAKRRKMERESIIAASALKMQDKTEDGEGGEVKIHVPKPPEGQEVGGWQDAAWLLSVASKALF